MRGYESTSALAPLGINTQAASLASTALLILAFAVFYYFFSGCVAGGPFPLLIAGIGPERENKKNSQSRAGREETRIEGPGIIGESGAEGMEKTSPQKRKKEAKGLG